MKKMIVFTLFFTLFGCVAGDFPENREKLYRMGHDNEICKTQPEKCINGTVW